MLITLVLILLLIWAAVVWSIYSNFLVFYSNFNESENYHKAYYSSIAALERAELVIKQRAPWYEWSAWWKIWVKGWTWYNNNWWSDGIIDNKFSYLSNNWTDENTSTIFWKITSKTTRIPAIWKWDVDPMLMLPNWDSEDFNTMDYNDSQVFLLYYDKSEWNPYEKTKWCPKDTNPCQQSNPEKITWIIRLPQYLSGSFWNLDDTSGLIAWQKNDAIVDWQIRWNYRDNNKSYPFTIYAVQNKIFASQGRNGDDDSAIRESDINDELGDHKLDFEFSRTPHSKYKRSPTERGNSAELIIISPKETKIKDDVLWCKDPWCLKRDSKNLFFETFLKDENQYFTDKQVRFSLLNLLETKKEDGTDRVKTYPFLEYYADFWTGVSDKYFTIDAEWNYGDYKINKIIWKPTNKESILGNFTSIL